MSETAEVPLDMLLRMYFYFEAAGDSAGRFDFRAAAFQMFLYSILTQHGLDIRANESFDQFVLRRQRRGENAPDKERGAPGDAPAAYDTRHPARV